MWKPALVNSHLDVFSEEDYAVLARNMSADQFKKQGF